MLLILKREFKRSAAKMSSDISGFTANGLSTTVIHRTGMNLENISISILQFSADDLNILLYCITININAEERKRETKPNKHY